MVVSLPAIALAVVLLYTTFARLAFPYDLEWMEGGVLTHASRLADGQGREQGGRRRQDAEPADHGVASLRMRRRGPIAASVARPLPQ